MVDQVEVGEQGGLWSTEPMKVARWLLDRGVFRTPSGKRGLWLYRGEWVVWDEGKWVLEDQEEVENRVMLALEDAVVLRRVRGDGEDEVTAERYRVTSEKAREVVRAMRAIAPVTREQRMPFWGDGRAGHGKCVAFLDVVVDLVESARRGEVVTVERSEEWFDTQVVPLRWKECEGAEAEVWERCLEEWGGGEEGWAELVERMMVYCLMGYRGYAVWFMLAGKIRGGKGTIVRTLRRLMGRRMVFGTKMRTLASEFGKDGLQGARVLTVSEVGDLSRGAGEEVAMLLKEIVGRDTIDVNRKNKPYLKDVVVDAVPVLLGNKIPRMPDDAGGVSGKMRAIAFEHSWAGRENFDLEEEIGAGLRGVARRLIRAGIRLEQETRPDRKFVVTESGMEKVRMFQDKNNLVARYLRERFVQAPKMFVDNDYLRRDYEGWCREMGVGMGCSRRDVPRLLIEQSPWPLWEYRQADGGKRGVRGMAIALGSE